MVTNNKTGKNLNEPGTVEEERLYYDDKEERKEQEKVPVEYLGYLKKRKEFRRLRVAMWIVLLILFLGLGPGTKGKIYCPRNGEWRNHFTFAWGRLQYNGYPNATEWTRWYESKSPEIAGLRWVPYGEVYPAVLGVPVFPWPKNLGWEMPENLVKRMQELEPMFRPGFVMEIPRVLSAVNNARDWNAIIVPLTIGTPQQAFEWWNAHRFQLQRWSRSKTRTPLPDRFVAESEAYAKRMLGPTGSQIPLVD